MEFHLNGIYPVCKCKCGKRTSWNGHGFKTYAASGHSNKIHNNWGHNPKAILKSAETRRQQYASGERQTWCKGLTKETDDRIKAFGKKVSLAFTKQRKIEYSKRMSKMRRDGTMPTLYREKSSQWRGGVSSIQRITRAAKRLHDEWKFPILKGAGFKCVDCSSNKELHVHHDGESFSNIIKKVMTIDDYEHIDDFERKKLISEKVIDYHVQNKVSGKVLCRKCHKKIHPSLNFKDIL